MEGTAIYSSCEAESNDTQPEDTEDDYPRYMDHSALVIPRDTSLRGRGGEKDPLSDCGGGPTLICLFLLVFVSRQSEEILHRGERVGVMCSCMVTSKDLMY